MKNSIRFLACSIFLQMFALAGANAALMSNAVLMFDPSVYGTGDEEGLVVGGTFFSFDMDGNGDIALWERTGMTPYNGIQLGTAQPASWSHSGLPDGTESPSIDEPWSFFANTGMHFSNTPVNVISSTGNMAYLDMSGWGITWNGIPGITFGSGSWGSNPEGQAVVTCDVDCAIGDTFSLYYTATVPLGDPSGFGGVRYRLGLDGASTTVQSLGLAQIASFGDSDPGMIVRGTIAAAAVPLPLSLWLFISGLFGLIGVARRKAV